MPPEILKIQGKFSVQIFDFLFQYATGGLLEKGIFQAGDGQEIYGSLIALRPLVCADNILQIDTVWKEGREIFKQFKFR